MKMSSEMMGYFHEVGRTDGKMDRFQLSMGYARNPYLWRHVFGSDTVESFRAE